MSDTRHSGLQKGAAVAVLIAAFVLLILGIFCTRKVYDAQTEAVGVVAFIKLSDRNLVVDATFTGVERRNGRLYSTYDRSQPRGKQACPT